LTKSIRAGFFARDIPAYRASIGVWCLMDRIPTQNDLTPIELSSLCEIAHGFRSRAIPVVRIARLVQLGLIQEVMGGLMITPAGRIVARR
jgi:hypothetical protein